MNFIVNATIKTVTPLSAHEKNWTVVKNISVHYDKN